TQAEPSAKTLTEEYVHGRRVEEVQYAAGYVERISVGIVVTADTPAPEHIALIEQVLRSGLGIDSTRGDSFSLIWHPPQLRQIEQADSADIVQSVPAKPQTIDVVETTAKHNDGMQETAKAMLAMLFLAGFAAALITTGAIFGLHRYRRQQQRKALLAQLTVWLANE